MKTGQKKAVSESNDSKGKETGTFIDMETFKAYLLAQNLGVRSVKEYCYWIDAFERQSGDRGWSGILRYKEACMSAYTPSTQKVVFTALNHYAQHKGYNKKLTLPRTTATFKREIISHGELSALIDNLVGENYNIALRNRAILRILWGTGMRIGELLKLKWSDIGPTHICVTSKGNRTRHVPYKNGLFDGISGVYQSEYVICTAKGKPLSYSAVHRFFKELGRSKFSPHSLRHSYASRLLHSGVPINYVSELLGHSSVDTTLIYLHYKSNDIVRELELKDWINEI